MFTLLLIAASILPTPPDVLRDACDLVKLIFQDWSEHDSRYHVDFARGGYACVWVDGEVTRSVRAGEYRESWSQHDPELLEREILPKEKRRGLRGAR